MARQVMEGLRTDGLACVMAAGIEATLYLVLSLPAALRALLTRQPMSEASRHELTAAATDPLSTVVHLLEFRMIRLWPKLAARIFDKPVPGLVTLTQVTQGSPEG